VDKPFSLTGEYGLWIKWGKLIIIKLYKNDLLLYALIVADKEVREFKELIAYMLHFTLAYSCLNKYKT